MHERNWIRELLADNLLLCLLKMTNKLVASCIALEAQGWAVHESDTLLKRGTESRTLQFVCARPGKLHMRDRQLSPNAPAD